MDDFREEAKEAGDGGDLDVEVYDCYDHDKVMVLAQAEQNEEEGNMLVVEENYCTPWCFRRDTLNRCTQ